MTNLEFFDEKKLYSVYDNAKKEWFPCILDFFNINGELLELHFKGVSDSSKTIQMDVLKNAEVNPEMFKRL